MSDSFDMKEVDGVVYEVDCAMITEGAVQVGKWSSFESLTIGTLCADECLKIPEPMHLLRKPRRV